MSRSEREWAPRRFFVATCLLAAAVVLAGVCGLAWAQGDEGRVVYSAFNGKVSYKIYCMNCHGVTGKGDGYLADSLKQVPSDLTVMAKKNNGTYPVDRVWGSIDGREFVKLHGMREMPIWGDAFRWPEDSPEKEAEAKRKIGDLVEYVKTIQEPPVAK